MTKYGRVLWTGLLSATWLGAGAAYAHHSAAMFDNAKTITVAGAVTRWDFVNPHSWLHIETTGADGKKVGWSFEGGGPSGGAFRKDSFKAGDKITVETHPMKDGRPAGTLGRVTFADGRVLGGGFGGPPRGGAGGPAPGGVPAPGGGPPP